MGKKVIGTSIPMPAPFNAGSSNPIDTRYVVDTYNALLDPNTYGTSGDYCFVHEGLSVYVSEQDTEGRGHKKYTYIGPSDDSGVKSVDVRKKENWAVVAFTTENTSIADIDLRLENLENWDENE